jgi:hypothetical protein
MLWKLSLIAGLSALTALAALQPVPAASAPPFIIQYEPTTGVTPVANCKTYSYRHYYSAKCWHTDTKRCCWYGKRRHCDKVHHHHNHHCD